MDLQQIGLQHPRIRQLRHVLNNSSPNLRRFLVAEGLWAHDVLLELGTPIEVFLWCPEAASTRQARRRGEQIAARAEHAYRISPKVLERLVDRDRPDGLVSLVGLPRWDPAALAFGRRSLVLVADGIEIPGNLGAMVRTLDACGGDCLILTNRRTRLSHPMVFRGSRGMVLRVPVVELDGPEPAAAWLRERDFTVYLATPGPGAVAYPEVTFGQRTAFVVGNERYGISPPWFDLGFTRVTVPMLGVADSLNVSVSASILLYAVRVGAGAEGTIER
jgi:tRNA G18 (ribose-2'-O)-methylase SpoU